MSTQRHRTDFGYCAPLHKPGHLVDVVDERWRRDRLPTEDVPLPPGVFFAVEDEGYEDVAQVLSGEAEQEWNELGLQQLLDRVRQRDLAFSTHPFALPTDNEIERPGAAPEAARDDDVRSGGVRAPWHAAQWPAAQRWNVLSQGAPVLPPTPLSMREQGTGANAAAATLMIRARGRSAASESLSHTPGRLSI
ncbi:hypothetical protein CDCA_CDCA01G0419 [Cyanidium caldarium]|uniref:Anaphase-promoting complex subunit 13 n=1 Tax=Cyanidium caldarium TaxID=2771 RepID=A0AAV9IQI4_CYACA|nr:hypothetical protein CDCA_CDCA01G0419 [Cyanidium caldarium]